MGVKASLTFEEKVTAAYLHFAQGVDQHVIASAMLVNPGRVAEACIAAREALKPKSAPSNMVHLAEKRA